MMSMSMQAAVYNAPKMTPKGAGNDAGPNTSPPPTQAHAPKLPDMFVALRLNALDMLCFV